MVRSDLDVEYCAVIKLTFSNFVSKKVLPLIEKKSIDIAMFKWCCAIIGGNGILSILLCMSGFVCVSYD